MARIDVIIVSYNTGELACSAVRSVLEAPHADHDVHIHLVDNASDDDSATLFARQARKASWADRVTLYLETENHGFGRGNNIVLHRLAQVQDPPEYVFLLNPDARLKNATIAVLTAFLDSHPKAAVAGARAFNPGNPVPVTAAFRFPGMISVFSEAINFGPVARLLRKFDVALPPDLPTRQVDWVSGAAVLARFDVWRDLGFFDPEYFLYFEEVDLMRRTKAAGWQCWHVAEAEIIHIEGAATQVRSADTARPRRPAYWYHSWQYYFRTTHGRLYAIVTAVGWMTGAACNTVLSKVRGTTPHAPKRFFTDFWHHSVRPLIGLAPRA
jgi:GT2 family glycosyltransferase